MAANNAASKNIPERALVAHIAKPPGANVPVAEARSESSYVRLWLSTSTDPFVVTWFRDSNNNGTASFDSYDEAVDAWYAKVDYVFPGQVSR